MPQAEKPIAARPKMTTAEIALAVQLREDGLTQVQIAERLNRSQSTISELLSEFTSTKALARKKADSRALKLTEAALDGAEGAAREGKPEAALEVLDRLEVLPKRQVDSGRSAVNIVIGMPGQPAGPDVDVCISSLSPPVAQQLPE